MKFFLTLLLAFYLLLPTPAHAQSVDLVWQGEAYTPPFYQGATPWAKQSVISLVAIPQDLGNPASLNYKWTKNGTVLGSLSGVGRNTLRIMDSVLSKPQNFRVEIISAEDEVVAQSSFNITPQEPAVLVYEDNPLYGILFHRALTGNFQLSGEEVVLRSFPLFFAVEDADAPELQYIWRSNAREDSRSNQVTYRRPEGASGSTAVSARISNTEAILPLTETSFLIQFGK